VTLIRPGVEKEEFALPEETTLADLFQRTRVQTEGHVVLIDGKPLEEIIVLKPGMTITVVAD
jgi:sulfur carrier protein ThiS